MTVLKSDRELEQESNCNLDAIRTNAIEILAQIASKCKQNKSQQAKSKNSKTAKKAKKARIETDNSQLFQLLFNAYDKAEESLTRCSLAYLLKNNCQASAVEEDPEQLGLRRRATEIEIERLKAQIKNRIPKGRDLAGEQWLNTLDNATFNIPKDENEAKFWQASLLRQSSCIPYPISYGSNTDVNKWLKNDKGRIFVTFNGLGEHVFEVCCGARQLHWFERFVEDWKTWNSNQKTYCAGEMALRSVRLVWHKKKGKGKPWNIHGLSLHCSIDTRQWTAEGAEQVRQEKITRADKTISNMTQKGKLNKNQQQRLESERSKRERLNHPFPGRPSKPLYQGQAHILVGVSLGLKQPATVAVVDASKNKVLIYRTVKQLLGKNYHLLNRQRQQQQRFAHERHKAQKQNVTISLGESELGKYVDRLLAVSTVAIAKTYQAGSIVLPKLSNVREQVSSAIQALAEKKILGYKQGQQNYSRRCHVRIHRWSYGRLMKNIQSFAAQTGMAIEVGQQPIRNSQQEKARDLALFAYHSRQLT